MDEGEQAVLDRGHRHHVAQPGDGLRIVPAADQRGEVGPQAVLQGLQQFRLERPEIPLIQQVLAGEVVQIRLDIGLQAGREGRPGQDGGAAAVGHGEGPAGPGGQGGGGLVPHHGGTLHDLVRVGDEPALFEVTGERLEHRVVHAGGGDVVAAAVARQAAQRDGRVRARERGDERRPGGRQGVAARAATQASLIDARARRSRLRALRQRRSVSPAMAGANPSRRARRSAGWAGTSSSGRLTALATVRMAEAVSWRRRAVSAGSASTWARTVARVGAGVDARAMAPRDAFKVDMWFLVSTGQDKESN